MQWFTFEERQPEEDSAITDGGLVDDDFEPVEITDRLFWADWPWIKRD